MVYSYTNSYTYQPNTPKEKQNDYDRVCNAIMEYVKEYGEKHGMSIETAEDTTSWSCHNNPIPVTVYFLKYGDTTTPIEDVAGEILACYKSYLEDEASNFGEYGYYLDPWDAEDLAVFTRENMIEYWS